MLRPLVFIVLIFSSIDYANASHFSFYASEGNYAGDSFLGLHEICDNGIDDDRDGLIDLNDDECECAQTDLVSLIPNPSFEEMSCCPQQRNALSCANTWIQASEPTTDYIHTCGWMGWPDLEAPQPFPDGDGIVGFRDGRSFNGQTEKTWKEYVGACLNGPLLRGNEYTFEFYLGFVNPNNSPSIELTFFGTTDCENLPFGIGNEELGCPTNGPNWQFLSSINISGSNWVKTTLILRPEDDIYAIAIGPPCTLTQSSENLYYFIDNLVLADSKFFDVEISSSNSPCNNEFLLSIPDIENANFQWYKNGIALEFETNISYQPEGDEGTYEVLIDYGTYCKLSTPYEFFIPVRHLEDSLTICDQSVYSFNGQRISDSGIYTSSLLTEEGCDSLVTLKINIQKNAYSEQAVKIFNGDSYEIGNFSFSEEGAYEVVLQSALNCDSTVNLNLQLYNIFIPNVFSPNEDGINDVFEIHNGEETLEILELKIISRWGEPVFSANTSASEKSLAWDGTSKGIPVEPGLYTYQIIVEERNATERQIVYGSMTLMR